MKHPGANVPAGPSNSATFVWLHPRRVDFSRPVHILVNGQPCFDGRVSPSLAAALDSYQRRHDWNLVYPARITLEVLAHCLPGDAALELL